LQGFIIFLMTSVRVSAISKTESEWFTAGRIKYREDIVRGLERAPEAFIGCFKERTSENW